MPGELQLSAYTPRLASGRERRLLTLSDSTERWAREVLPEDVAGVPVEHWSWDDVRELVATAKTRARGVERLWLDQLEGYLGEATSKRPVSDSLAYCVVVSNDPFGGITFRNYVPHHRVYFHSFASGGWPPVPPNFLAFRWDNAVRQLNRVVDYEVVGNLREQFPSVTPEESGGPHVVYQLGPNIPLPSSGVPSGRKPAQHAYLGSHGPAAHRADRGRGARGQRRNAHLSHRGAPRRHVSQPVELAQRCVRKAVV